MITITTVGYGDITPVTVLGRLMATVLLMVGIGMIDIL
ncbi:ion channel [Lysinibacillus xylanilyticus]